MLGQSSDGCGRWLLVAVVAMHVLMRVEGKEAIVLEYEQVTCWFRVGLLDFETMVKLSKFVERGT